MTCKKRSNTSHIKNKNGSIISKQMKSKRLTLVDRFNDYKGQTKQSEYWMDDPVVKEIV